VAEISSVKNHGGDGEYKNHVFVSFDERTKLYGIKFTSTYTSSKNPSDHQTKLQLYLTEEQYQTLLKTLENKG